MKNIALVIFDYFEYGGVQKDLDALGKMLRLQSEERGVPLKLTLLCMHNRAATIPAWCDELQTIAPPWYIISNHGRAKWFSDQLARIKKEKRFDLLIGFNRNGSLDFYFAGDDCLKEKYLKRSKLASLLPRGRTFLALEKLVFSPVNSGGAGKIFTITSPQQKAFMRCYPGCSPDRFTLMPPLLADEYFERGNTAQLRDETRTEFAISDETLLFIQIAAAFRTKGVDRSLALLGEAKKRGILPDFKFIIVGGTSDKVRNEMKLLAKECGLTESEVVFTGPRQDVRRLLCGADLMLHPARAESAGGVLIEALASGVPVLSSNICGYNSFIQKADAGAFLPEPFELSPAVDTLQKVLTNLPAFRKNAETYAVDNITPEFFQRARSEAKLILDTFETSPLDFSKEQ